MSKPEHDVPITIDKQHHRSPRQTTGSALYALGNVPGEYDLWLEVKGPGDDEIVHNSDLPVEVEPGSHYYTAQRTLNPGAQQ
jgi:hypothetical protein